MRLGDKAEAMRHYIDEQSVIYDNYNSTETTTI